MKPNWTQLMQQMQNDPSLNEKLSQNALSILSILGGMENVITLCLTHPESDEEYCNQVLCSINHIVADIQIVSSESARRGD